MEKLNNTAIRAIIITTLCICIIDFSPAWCQQQVIADMENTRPEVKASLAKPPFISFLSATKWNGYNEIKWAASREDDTRKHIVEYSTDGLNYQTAGEILVNNSSGYTIKHHILDERPMLYRVRSEQLNGKSFYSANVVLDGIPVSPVKLYPTVITSNTVNVNTAWPVERVNIYASNGSQVFNKEIGGQRDYMAITIPHLSKGMYWMTFYGANWKTTEKFVVQ